MKKPQLSPSVVSLFAGCGGLDVGFKEEGYDLIYACDHDPIAIDAYKRNIDERAYVRDVTSDLFHSELRDIGSCDVVLGGFPCQGFSKAGPKKEGDARNFLYLEMKAAIETLRPKIFLAENVDGLSQNFKGTYLDAITKDFESIGYHVEHRTIDSVTFGVPQHRRRIYFIGTRSDQRDVDFEWPSATHTQRIRNGETALRTIDLFLNNKANQEPTTIAEAIGDLRQLGNSIPDHQITNSWPANTNIIIKKIGPGQKLCNVRHSATSVHTWEIPEYFGKVTKTEVAVLETIAKNRRHKQYGTIPNGNPLEPQIISNLSGIENVMPPIKALLEKNYLKEIHGKYDLKGAMFCSGLYKRPDWNAPSPTVLTNFHSPRYFIHPKENRPFSLRECARLQGFPDSFTFTTDNSPKALAAGYRLVGNAVSPPVGRAFALAIYTYLLKEAEIEAKGSTAFARREAERV